MRHRWLAPLIAMLAVIGGATTTVAAAPGTDWFVRTWQTDDGLPDNNVTGIEQSADGHLWISTLGGLMRFDGARFEEYSLVHFPRVLTRNVRRSYLDRRGRLWLSLERGALVRVGADSFKIFTGEEGLVDGRVGVMADDPDGALWMVIGTAFYKVAGDRIERVGTELGIPGGGSPWVGHGARDELWLARGNQLGVIRDQRWHGVTNFDAGPIRFVESASGGFWVAAGTQLFKFDEGRPLQLIGRLPERAAVRVLMEDAAQRLWVGTASDGVFVQQGADFVPVPVSHPEVLDLKADREGNVWVGTSGGGLNLVRPQAVSLMASRQGLAFDSVRSVCEDPEGWIWAALQNGELARGRDGVFNAVTAADGWPGGNVNCVTAARGGGVWIGTRDRGLQRWQAGRVAEFSRAEGLGSTWVRSALETASGELWLATEQPGQLCLFDGKTFRRFDVPEGTRNIRALAQTTDGMLWAGTSDGQLLHLQGTQLISEGDTRHSIRCLHATPDGSLWIGYAGWGIARLRAGHYSRVDGPQGLYDSYVYQLLFDGRNGMWVAANHGLFQVQYDALVEVAEGRARRVRSTAFGRSEGMPSVQSVCDNSPSCWRGGDGKLWFATRKGVLAVAPERIRANPRPPPVKLTRVHLDDRVAALYESRSPLRTMGETNALDLAAADPVMELPPAHDKLEFEFTGLSFSAPENVHFRYRLTGFDQSWVEAGATRSAKYPRLPAGDYRFEVTACNEVGVWNPTPAALTLVVAPFFWQTWWFRLLVVSGFTGSLIGLVRYFSFRRLRQELERLERQAELQRERTRIARDMHDEVGTKLSRLSLLSEMTRQQPGLSPGAQGEVAEISETARETIRSFEEIVWAVNPKNDSLSDLVNYLCRFAEDFFEGSPTQCVFDLPAEIPALELSTETRHHVFLAAKEALNNALKHSRARVVTVRLRLHPGEVAIEVLDDGVGFDLAATPTRAGRGNGLGNMRERMRLANGTIDLQSAVGKGTVVCFHLPLNSASSV